MIQITVFIAAGIALVKLFTDNRRIRQSVTETKTLINEIIEGYSEILAEEIEEYLDGAA